MPDGEIAVDDPRSADIRELLQRHLTFAHTHTPPQDVHALDIEGLLDPAVTFYSYRLGRQLVAVGALKQLDPRHGEVKSMHTVQEARGRGVGRAMLNHLIAVARDRGYQRVSLETGTVTAFTPARSLYASAGFEPCGRFADYQPSPSNTFMSLLMAGPDSARSTRPSPS